MKRVNTMMPPFAILRLLNDTTYRMCQERIIIGRSTTSAPVDIDVGPSSFVSRQHLELVWRDDVLSLLCNGKNGIFVNKSFRIHDAVPHAIPSKCVLRFPSTSICIRVRQCLRNGPEKRIRRVSLALNARRAAAIESVESASSDNSSGCSFAAKKRSKLSAWHPREVEHFTPDDDDEDIIVQYSVSQTTAQSRNRRKQALVPACSSIPQVSQSDALLTNGITTKVDPVTPTPISDLHSTPQSFTPTAGKPVMCSGDLVLTSVPVLSSTSTLLCLTEMTKLERGDRDHKPPYSYAQLITQAIVSQSDRQLTLSGIYDYISKNYPYYRPQDKGWQNSVRHNLSLNRHFIKVPRSQDDHGKGCFWRIDPIFETRLLSLAFRKRRSRGYDTLPTSPSCTPIGIRRPATNVITRPTSSIFRLAVTTTGSNFSANPATPARTLFRMNHSIPALANGVSVSSIGATSGQVMCSDPVRPVCYPIMGTNTSTAQAVRVTQASSINAVHNPGIGQQTKPTRLFVCYSKAASKINGHASLPV